VRLWGAIARGFPEEAGDEQEELLASVLQALGERASDESKAVRFRACQLLSQVINQLPEDLCPMADDDMEALQEQLVERLEDKVAAARAMAAHALKRLTQPNEVRSSSGWGCNGF
jgi:condensin complex subunit 3